MATQSAVTAAASTVSSVVSSVPQTAQAAAVAAQQPDHIVAGPGIWNSARQLFSLTAPKVGKDGDFTFTFLTSPQRSKPAATVNADNFYMYACGSINMP